MSDTNVTVVEQEGEEPPKTPDTVAETAVAAIGETSRAAATASTAADTSQQGAFQSQDAAERAKLEADRAEQAAQQIGQWAASITDAVSAIPVKIAETLQSLVQTAPPAETTTETTTEAPKTVQKPQGHWATRKRFGRAKSSDS